MLILKGIITYVKHCDKGKTRDTEIAKGVDGMVREFTSRR